MLKQRVLAAAVLIPGFLLALFYASPLLWMGLMGLGTLLAAWEWARIAAYATPGRALYVLIVALCLLGLYFFPHPELTMQAMWGIALLFWLALVPLWLARHWLLRQSGVLALVGLIVLLPTWQAMVSLREHGIWLLLFLMVLVWVADIAAYVCGRIWGKHKLAPRISPGKTWEGAAGALAGGALYALSWQAWAPADYAHLFGLTSLGLALVAIFLVTISIVGDLFESHMKRCAGLKDSGHLIPGHGGILDRIDSQTSVLPVACAALYFLQWMK